MNDCIFCKIAAGQIKSTFLYEDEAVLAFRDVHPQAPVHILIIPKKHIERISEATETNLPVFVNIHRAAKALIEKEPILKEGFRFLSNNGPMAGQSVNHLHYHLLGGRKMSHNF
jgi:histidine triad (HIT) family protein